MVMGIIILKKRYTFDKYLSVILITAGIAICTIMSSKEVKSTVPASANTSSVSSVTDFIWWCIGIFVLSTALFISARMGIYQEYLFSTYGKHPKEALYYSVSIELK